MLLKRGLALGVLGVAWFAGCTRSKPPPVVQPPIREAGLFEAAAQIDSDPPEVEDDAPDVTPDVETPDAGLAPIALGVTPVVPTADASASDQTLAELNVLAAGVRARALVARLDDLLDAAGAPSASVFAGLGAAAALYRARGRSVLFTIAVVDRTTDARPSRLQASWGSAELLSTLEAVIDRSYETFGAELSYLSFGTDVDRFLTLASSTDRSAAAAFLAQGLSYAKAHTLRLPNTQIGVTFSLSGLIGDRLPETNILLHQSDAAIVTDFPLDPSFRAMPTRTAASQLGTLADVLESHDQGLPVVVQELGYPSSTLVGSSPEQQRKFYQAVFEVLGAQSGRFPFVNLYASMDCDEAECARQAVSFGAAGDPLLMAARCSLGLEDGDGTEKPAWGAVLEGLSTFGRP